MYFERHLLDAFTTARYRTETAFHQRKHHAASAGAATIDGEARCNYCAIRCHATAVAAIRQHWYPQHCCCCC